MRINGDLQGTPRVHVIGAFGQDLGEMELVAAVRLAMREELDLVEVNPLARPIVCKLLDFKQRERDKEAIGVPPLLRSEIDLHDSTVIALRTDGSDVVLGLDAYVHVSEGHPGVDPGEIWQKPVEVTIRDGVVRNSYDGQRLLITEGIVRVGERVWQNMIPVVLNESGPVELILAGYESKLNILGTALKIEATSVGCFVDWAE